MLKRKTMFFIWAISLAAFVGLTVNVLNGGTQGFNGLVYSFAEKLINPFMTNAMIFISNVGEWYTYSAVVILFLLVPKTRFSIGITLGIAISLSAIANNLTKNIFAVTRPDIRRLIEISGFGYPSGHAMNGAVFFGLCTYLLARHSGNKTHKLLITLFSVLFVLLIGFSRIYLGVHTASDVLGGFLAGVFIILSAVFVMDKMSDGHN